LERRQTSRIAAVIRVHYRKHEDFILDYARDISQGGLFISTPEPLPPGEAVELHVDLPGRDEPLCLPGRVKRALLPPAGGGAGMGIEFGPLSDEAQEAVNAYLRQFETDREFLVDRRGRSTRFPQVMPIRYAREGEQIPAHTDNLSHEGVYLRSVNLPAGSECELFLRLPDGRELQMRARATHSLDGDLARSLGRVPGTGFQFIRFHDTSQEILWDYLNKMGGGGRARRA
jgi:type IV pilus assembly protein PilZ